MKKSKLIPFTKAEWNGKEAEIRTDRVNLKLEVSRGKQDEQELAEQVDFIMKLVEGASVKRFNPKTGRLVLSVPEGTDIVKLCKELGKRGKVVYAEPDFISRAVAVPNDDELDEQWALGKIDAYGAWDLERGTPDVLIGIIDSGISIDAGGLSHDDLDDTGRFILGTDFVDGGDPEDGNGHGTHVTGTAAAETDNDYGIAGMNWNSPVYVCRTLDNNGNGSSSDLADAIEEIVDFAVARNLRAVINYSGGGPDNNTKRDACRYLHDNGMILCAATGNDYRNPVISPALYSATFSGVIAVGATNSADEVTDFSNVGAEVSVVAPGEEILSTFPTYDVTGDSVHDFVSWDGTSMATPHVTGLASLVWSRESRLSNEQVRDVVQNTAVKLGAGTFNNNWGFGRIDAADAVAKAGWELTPVQTALHFIDIPEGETQIRSIRIDVNSFHATTLEVSVNPGAPFSLYNYSGPLTLGKTTDYDTPRPFFVWVKYTGTLAGDTANTTAQVRCTTTGEVFDITITANTIARPTCAMVLALDRSGSMLQSSGIGGMTREQVLRYSAGIFVNYVRQNNALGMVTFDENAHDLLYPVAGPFGAADDPFDPARSSAVGAYSSYAANPGALTAIGDGIERAHNHLSGVSGYDKKAIIVFTDGHETASKYIADVQHLIDEQVFAVGLGTADQLNPAALDNICNNTGGYLVLTDSLDDDDTFRIAKYFLQIQAGVNNEQIVVDPTGYVAPGQKVRIPFRVNEADISLDAILMTTLNGVLEFAIETPDGNLIDAANLSAFPTVMRADGEMVSYYRLTMPVQDGAGISEQTGQWNMVLSINERYWKKYLSMLEKDEKSYRQAVQHGVKYTALVHAYSNLRMSCKRSQSSYEPGATVNIRAALTEYGVPLSKTASVRADLKMPDGTMTNVVFSKVSEGVYETNVAANYNGVYTFTVKASGKTSRNAAFTREQVVTAAVWKGGNTPPPDSHSHPGQNPGKDALCELIHCLIKTSDKELKENMRKNGVDLERLAKCYCSPSRKG